MIWPPAKVGLSEAVLSDARFPSRPEWTIPDRGQSTFFFKQLWPESNQIVCGRPRPQSNVSSKVPALKGIFSEAMLCMRDEKVAQFACFNCMS
jgi:hypothetical protein